MVRVDQASFSIEIKSPKNWFFYDPLYRLHSCFLSGPAEPLSPLTNFEIKFSMLNCGRPSLNNPRTFLPLFAIILGSCSNPPPPCPHSPSAR